MNFHFLIAIPIIDLVPPFNKEAASHLILSGSCKRIRALCGLL